MLEMNEGEFCWIKTPYSDWHGFRLIIEYWPDYGIVSPNGVTTNGNPNIIKEFLNDQDLKDFIEFVQFTRNENLNR
jgi:hypothetical protein